MKRDGRKRNDKEKRKKGGLLMRPQVAQQYARGNFHQRREREEIRDRLGRRTDVSKEEEGKTRERYGRNEAAMGRGKEGVAACKAALWVFIARLSRQNGQEPSQEERAKQRLAEGVAVCRGLAC